VRGPATEACLVGRALTPDVCQDSGAAALADVAPIDDIRGSAGYRKTVLSRMVADALGRIAAGREREAFPEAPILLQSDTTYPPSHNQDNPITSVRTKVNDASVRWPVETTRKTLLDALREDAGLTGAKEGCAEGECGACTVWLDGQAVMACLVPAAQANGSRVTTIEGLAGCGLHPLQQAFIDQAAVQCGFCIPGMIMAGAMLLDERSRPDHDDTRVALSGNICRCTGYRKILAAVDQAAGGGAG
jgi:carbon-monoxide dehydrogenase medium subunit